MSSSFFPFQITKSGRAFLSRELQQMLKVIRCHIFSEKKNLLVAEREEEGKNRGEITWSQVQNSAAKPDQLHLDFFYGIMSQEQRCLCSKRYQFLGLRSSLPMSSICQTASKLTSSAAELDLKSLSTFPLEE